MRSCTLEKDPTKPQSPTFSNYVAIIRLALSEFCAEDASQEARKLSSHLYAVRERLEVGESGP